VPKVYLKNKLKNAYTYDKKINNLKVIIKSNKKLTLLKNLKNLIYNY
jgi:hypothetical protein